MVRLPARTVLWAAIFAALFTLFGAANNALAHFGHLQEPVASTSLQGQPSISSRSVAEDGDVCSTENASAEPDGGSAPPIAPADRQSCCGSLACHAGLGDTASVIWLVHRFGEKLCAPLIAAPAGRCSSGVERPPRRS